MSENLPTLLRAGFVIPPKGASEKEQKIIASTISVDYILNFLTDKIPMTKNNMPKDMPVTFGDKVIILNADTGSGKSTVLPAKLHETFFERTHKNLIITQTRILTAIDIPSTIVPFNPELELGINIGYNTGPFKLIPEERGIIFSTIGVLSQDLIMNEDEDFMAKYQFVIIDEVHERDVETDRCLYLLKKLLMRNYKNPDCPILILMSATISEDVFIRYFEVPVVNFIQVKGKTFPIEASYPEYSVTDYIKYTSVKVQQLHLDNLEDIDGGDNGNGDNFRDIIIFIKDSGIGKKIADEIHQFNSEILSKSHKIIDEYKSGLGLKLKQYQMSNKMGGAKTNSNVEKKYYLLPIILDTQSFSKGGLEYQNLFSILDVISTPIWKEGADMSKDQPDRYEIPSRRVIIATNLAETGVTIPTLKYCIDTGYSISAEFYPEYGCAALISKNITLDSAIQRRGRVGRKAPGFWHACYTEDIFDYLSKERLTNIIINDTTETLLTMLIKEKNTNLLEETTFSKIKNNTKNNIFQMSLRVNNSWSKVKNELSTNIAAIDFIELPSMQSLSYSIEKLHILGFIDDSYDITPLGFFANQFQFISIDARKMIFSGYMYGANILDLITISAFVTVSKRKIFEKTFKMANFMKLNDSEFAYYDNVVIADDFVNAIFLWNIFQKFIVSGSVVCKPLAVIKKWCVDSGLKVEGVIKVIEMREVIIENMITIGLNPFYNGIGLDKYTYNLSKIIISSLPEGMAEIKKIKHCLYEGYKCNLLVNKRQKVYTSVLKNIDIKVKSNVTKDADVLAPKHIIVDSYLLSQKFNAAQFEFVSESFVSSMDNYVEVDEKFYLH